MPLVEIPGLTVWAVCFCVYSGMSDIRGHGREEGQKQLKSRDSTNMIKF